MRCMEAVIAPLRRQGIHLARRGFSGTVPKLNDIHGASFSGANQGLLRSCLAVFHDFRQNYSVQFVSCVLVQCARALRHWRAPSFLTQGVPMGRKVVTTDASLTGQGGVPKGQTLRGSWSANL